MSQIIRDLHDKYILDFDPNSSDMVVYKYCPATFSKAEGEFIYQQCATFSYSPSTGGGSTQSGIAGSWYDDANQTTTANTTTHMLCGHGSGNGITKIANRDFQVQHAGTYNIQFSCQLDQSSGAGHHIYIWFRKNDIDIPWSASEVAIQGSLAESIPSWNFLVDMAAGDHINIMYRVDNASVYLKAVAPNAIPGIPSVIVTMWKL